METNNNTTSSTTSTIKIRRSLVAGIPRSPRLSRQSSSGTSPVASISPQQSLNKAPFISLPETRSLGLTATSQPPPTRVSRSATTSPRPSFHRSRSTTKSRTTPNDKDKDKDEMMNYNNNIPASRVLGSPQRKLSFDNTNNNGDGIHNVAKLFRSSSHNMGVKSAGGRLSLTSSPSAWALSPGRASPVPAPESPKVKAVGGVLKYFNRQKKVCPTQEEEFHQYRIMYNRLLQWRFANAKAEVVNAKIKTKVEEKMFGVWLKIYKMRYAIAEKRMKVERLKQKTKLFEILCPQLDLLGEWEKLEKKNFEAIGRVSRKLSAFSTRLPLLNGATATIVSLFEAMSSALDVMENVEGTIINFHLEAERVCNLLRELINTVQQNMECFQELEKEITSIMSLEAHEKSLTAHIIQTNREIEKEDQEQMNNCKHHLMRSFRNKDTPLTFSMLNVS